MLIQKYSIGEINDAAKKIGLKLSVQMGNLSLTVSAQCSSVVSSLKMFILCFLCLRVICVELL